MLRLGLPPGKLPLICEKLPAEIDLLVDFAAGLIWLSLPGDIELRSLMPLAKVLFEWQGYVLPLAGSIVEKASRVGLTQPPGSLGFMRALKARWDPGGLFNPQSFPGL